MKDRGKVNRSDNPAPVISVIIPAHNAEKTLRRAVESALAVNETLAAADSDGMACEILVIENGSDDGSEFLGRTLELEHPGVVRFFRSEKGVSNARNRGLEEAKGKWVLFLDADDYFLPEADLVLRDDLHFTGTDLIVHSYESGSSAIHLCGAGGERYSGSAAEDGTVQDISVRMIENPTRYTSVWSKLFRRDRIEYGHLRFDPALRLSEDSHFLIRYLTLCRRIRLLDRPFYHYSIDTPSAVRTWDGRKEEGYRKSLTAVQTFLRTQPQAVREAFSGYGMMQFNLLMVREVFAAGAESAKDTGAAGDDSRETRQGTVFPGRTYTMREKIARMVEISREEPFASAIRGYDPARHKGARYLPFRFLRKGLPAGAAAIYEARVLQNRQKEKAH